MARTKIENRSGLVWNRFENELKFLGQVDIEVKKGQKTSLFDVVANYFRRRPERPWKKHAKRRKC